MGAVGLSENSISQKIRKNIFDGMNLENVHFSGRLNDYDFLSRLYTLGSMPSYDSRYDTASADIWQHSVNNDDYGLNWVFDDPRFSLLSCSDQEFLDFLVETIHPLVRPEKDTAEKLVQHFNDQLVKVGFSLFEVDKIAGRAKFEAKLIGKFESQIDRALTAASVLSSNWMQQEITRIHKAVDSDPSLAIGTAKDLVESCCKSILQEMGHKFDKTDDLPKLSKEMCKALGLVPEGIPSEAKGAEIIKRTLSNLTAITKGISELRGLYGSGHGRDGKHFGLEPRHARLAASCAIAFVDFATETYLKKKAENNKL